MNPPAYEVRLRPGRGWFQVDWRGTWDYRDLLFLLVRRDFVSRYKQTVLGPLWFFLQPVLTTLVFTFVFSGIARLPTGGVPPALFFFCNQLGWNYFAGCFTSTSTALSGHQHIFSKVYFPRLIVPLAGLISNAFNLGIQLATFAAFYAAYRLNSRLEGAGLSALVVALPLLFLHVAAVAAGLGLWMSALTAKYRDLTHAAPLLLQLGLYAAPIVYPLSGVPERWRWLVAVNPLTAPVEAIRHALLGTGEIVPAMYGLSLFFTLLLLLSGIAVFSKVERTFVDVA